MKVLRNDQFDKFTLDHIVRPYQSMVWPEKKRIIGFGSGDDRITGQEIYEAALFEDAWMGCVCKRIAGIYSAIDYSFFPRIGFADYIRVELMRVGIEDIKNAY